MHDSVACDCEIVRRFTQPSKSLSANVSVYSKYKAKLSLFQAVRACFKHVWANHLVSCGSNYANYQQFIRKWNFLRISQILTSRTAY